MRATQTTDESDTVQRGEHADQRWEAGFWMWLAGLAGLVFVGAVLSVDAQPRLAAGLALLALVVILGTSLRAMGRLPGGETA